MIKKIIAGLGLGISAVGFVALNTIASIIGWALRIGTIAVAIYLVYRLTLWMGLFA